MTVEQLRSTLEVCLTLLHPLPEEACGEVIKLVAATLVAGEVSLCTDVGQKVMDWMWQVCRYQQTL